MADLTFLWAEVQPPRIAINPKLLKAATSGDIRILNELLQQRNISSEASVGEITRPIPTQEDTSCLLGVTQEGNTALHIVATLGHLELAKEICCREISLLAAPNKRLDTPLHYAARAGDDKMVSLIIQFARQDDIEASRVLRATNRDENNALHEAVIYNHVRVVEILMEEDAELASMPNDAHMSPLYLAIKTRSFNVAKILLRPSFSNQTAQRFYAGPDQKTVLHAAVLVNPEITKQILERRGSLAQGVDSLGRIPLHYAASDGHHDVVKLLLRHDPSTAYHPDAQGLYPIHIAASSGKVSIVDRILQHCPLTYELLDMKGRNFLHAAIQNRRLNVVKKIISKRPDLRKLLNDHDDQGNTPLHTAVENNDQSSVHFLLRDKTVHINIMNQDGFNPRHLAYAKFDKGLHLWKDSEACIYDCLESIGASTNPPDSDDFGRVIDNLSKVKSYAEAKDDKKEKDLSKHIVIASVLIATVTFAAGFTVPGGYIADDHPDRGTAVLEREYAFKVFLVSDAFALVLSTLATFFFTYAGILLAADKHTRRRTLRRAMTCLSMAFAGMSTAFAMGIYVALAPGYKRIGIALCIIAIGAPLLTDLLMHRNVPSVIKTITIRQGYRYSIWPNVALLVRLPCCFAIFFLLAML